MRELHKKAVAEPHGDLLIDLDTKTSNCLRFCSTNHILSAIITSKLYRSQQWARKLCIHPVSWKNSLQVSNKRLWHDFLIFCCECALNVINGTVGINLKELRPCEKPLRLLFRKSTSIKKRRTFVLSSKGLKLLNFINHPCSCYLTDWFLWIPKNFLLYQKFSTHKTI